MLTKSNKIHLAFIAFVLVVGTSWQVLKQPGVSEARTANTPNVLIQCVPIATLIKTAKTVEDLVQIARLAGVSEDLARLEFESADQDMESIREQMLSDLPIDYGCS